MRIQFETGQGAFGAVNFLSGRSDGVAVYAEVKVPEGASEDYGYLTMKRAVQKRIPNLELHFQYDGQEQYLSDDADADCSVYIDVYRGD